MKKILFLLSMFFFSISFATKDTEGNYEEYKRNIKEVCKVNNDKIIKSNKNYIDLEKNDSTSNNPIDIIENVNLQYSNTMNQIYRCALINTQIISLTRLKKDVAEKFDKTWDIKSWLSRKLDKSIAQIKKEKDKDCTNTSPKKSLYQKKAVLNEVTYETCKYFYYLNYLEYYFDNTKNISKWLFNDKDKQKNNKNNSEQDKKEEINKSIDKIKWIQADQIITINNKILEKLKNSKEHAKEVFNMSFAAYIEYENNFPIHILLNILKEDFIIFRQKLHKTLNPINQVVYKIANCMSN